MTLTYNEEVLETHSLGLQQILEQEEVNKLVQILNQPYRCSGLSLSLSFFVSSRSLVTVLLVQRLYSLSLSVSIDIFLH